MTTAGSQPGVEPGSWGSQPREGGTDSDQGQVLKPRAAGWAGDTALATGFLPSAGARPLVRSDRKSTQNLACQLQHPGHPGEQLGPLVFSPRPGHLLSHFPR